MLTIGFFIVAGATALVIVIVLLLWLRDKINTDRLPEKWGKALQGAEKLTLESPGKTKITILFEWEVSDGKYIGDAGVSYLIQTGEKKILFDLGDSYGKSNPDPVGHNIKQMGFDPQELAKELSAVVLSHHHRDHVGGFKQQMKKTFRMPADMLPDCPVYLPKDLSHHTLKGEILNKPKQILAGIALTGPLPGWMFFLGDTPEQMLVINADQGLVLVAGCGHPGIVQMAKFALQITGRPLFAFFGGAHALMDQSRSFTQRIIASKNPPWRPVTPDTIGIMATELSDLGIQKVYLSAHDSDDWAVSIFKTVFGEDLIILRVGETYEF